MKRLLFALLLGLGLSVLSFGVLWGSPNAVPNLVKWLRQISPFSPSGSTDDSEHDHAASTKASPLFSKQSVCATFPSYSTRLTLQSMTLGAMVVLDTPLPNVTLRDDKVAGEIAIEYANAELRRNVPSLVGNAEIAYNANLYAEVRPRVSGIIREVMVDEGSHVHAHDPMIVVDSAEVGTAKADYLAALPIDKLSQQSLEMTLNLRSSNAAPLKDELAARAAFNKSHAELLHTRQHLLNLGYSQEDLHRIALEEDTSNLHQVVAPIDGFVVERHAVDGEAIEPTHKLFGVADTRLMWAWIDVYEEAIELVAVGQEVSLVVFGAESLVFQGKVDWVDTAVNPTTRTIRVRAELGSPEGNLRANQFGRATIRVGAEREVVAVPRTAVQNIEGEDVVFVPIDERTFETRRVIVTNSVEPGVVYVTSLAPGRRVVSTGSFLLKSELLKDTILE